MIYVLLAEGFEEIEVVNSARYHAPCRAFG